MNEPVWVKCDYCGKMFTVPRIGLDTKAPITSITSMLRTGLKLPHPIITHVECRYDVLAEYGDFCHKCCIMFLKLGLEKIEHDIKNMEFSS